MTNKELKEYLDKFPDDTEFHVLLANTDKRKFYRVDELGVFDGETFPCLCVRVGEAVDFDTEMIKICKEEEQLQGQMVIEDFPEVMP